MSNTVIKVEDLSKQYRLGQVSTGTLSHDVNRWWHKVRGKEDPYLKIGETNDRTSVGSSDYVWALKDINFEVQQGEVLGIIGRNGAGKSTLLKILSRTTAPTTGSVKIKGRVASLLEVGTGFHPELSGRENVFLNGAIMGMTKKEIQRKFDEIVAFAGVERYIDTPVKRYSSGMYIRLAFAVAAHLEPEILIVDEVLAVGDAEFQKKCLGKMKDVSEKDGRTVLFVSHNMAAVKNLCTKGIYLSNGTLVKIGSIDEVVNEYNTKAIDVDLVKIFTPPLGNKHISILAIRIIPESGVSILDVNVGFSISFEFENFNITDDINCNIKLELLSGEHVFSVVTNPGKLSKGLYKATCFIPGGLLNDGIYSLSFLYVSNSANVLLSEENIIHFQIDDNRDADLKWFGKWPGIIRPKLKFIIE